MPINIGVIVGIALLVLHSMAMVRSASIGAALVLLTSIILIFFWIKWARWSNKNIPFELSLLIILSIFQATAILTLIFRLSPDYERFSHPPTRSTSGLTYRSTRTLPPLAVHSAHHPDFSSPPSAPQSAPPVNSIR
jgi:hypothetical protein